MKSHQEGKRGENIIDFRQFLSKKYGMKSKRVLIVEDEEDIALYLATLLENHDFLPSCAFSAEEALRQVKIDPPDLILLDIIMPGRGGLNLFSVLKKDKAYRNIPIIMVTGIKSKTGYDFPSFVGNLKVRMPEGYIEKPVDPDYLIQVIYKVLMNKSSQ